MQNHDESCSRSMVRDELPVEFTCLQSSYCELAAFISADTQFNLQINDAKIAKKLLALVISKFRIVINRR